MYIKSTTQSIQLIAGFVCIMMIVADDDSQPHLSRIGILGSVYHKDTG